MSFRKNKVSSFLKFVAAHFIELDSSSTHTPPSCHSARRAYLKLQNPLSHLAKDKLLTGEKMPVWADERWGKTLFPVPHPPSATVTPTSGERGLITRTWILRLRLRLRAEWQGGVGCWEEFKFSDYENQPKGNLMPCRLIGLMLCASVLDWSCANCFWNDALRIGFGMKLFLLVIDWCVYWIWIDAM